MSPDIWNDVAQSLAREPTDLDPNRGFVENGGHSLAAIAVSRLLKKKGKAITAEALLTCNCLADLLGKAPIRRPYNRSITESSLPSSTGSSSQSQNEDVQIKNYTSPSTHTSHASGDLVVRPSSVQPPGGTATTIGPTQINHIHRIRPSTARNGYKSPTRVVSTDVQKVSSLHHLPPSISFTDLRSLSHSNHNGQEQPKNIDNSWPMLTEMQLSLLHSSLKAPGSDIIHHSEIYLSEYLPVLRLAWQRVMDVEPVFKAQFPEELVGKDQITFEWVEVVALSPDHYDTLVQEAFDDIRIGSHFRVVTLAEPGQRSISNIIWSVHHALIDGYSASLLFEKIRRYTAGIPITAGPSFSDLATELHKYQSQHRDKGRHFWAEQNSQLASAKGALMIPSAISNSSDDPSIVTSEEIEINLGKEKLDAILAGARANKVTLAAMLHAAWALVLSHYASSELVVFGIVLSSRNLPLPGIAETIGPMVNTLPLCVAVDKKLKVQGYLRAVFEQMVRLSEFSWTTPNEHGYSRDFESAVAMQFDTRANDDARQPFLPIEKPKSKQTTSIPLSIAMDPDGTIHLQAHIRRISSVQFERIGQMLHDALLALCRPNATVEDCKHSLLSVPMLTVLREMGNANSGLTTIPSVTEDLVTLFNKAVQNGPDDVAVERGKKKMSYALLDELACILAAHLREFVQPGDVVCVHADRSIHWIVAIYGVLKARAVYCALDPSLPSELKDNMYQAAGAKAFIAASVESRAASPKSCDHFIDLQALLTSEERSASSRHMSRDVVSPADLAYLCFTSGSTGVPKGVLCAHRGLVAFEKDLEVRLFARPGERIAQVMSPAFDGSIHEIFSALSYGATLVLPEDGSQMFDHLPRATSCILTPSIARVLDPQDYPDLKFVYLVGEPVPPAVSDKWSAHVALYNMYGPTEGTCGATIKRLFPDQPVTIGKPNPTTRVYIMNEDRTLVPPGVIGEIFLAGVQVARGYIGLPEMTADRFVPDPVCPIGEYMYKTGDRGYWNEEGDLVCLGRNDREVKLRGFRLDMNDLEIRIARAKPDLQAVAVLVHNDQLMCVVQPADVDIPVLHSTLSRTLARHQRPARIIAMDILPSTRAGKTDYLALGKLLSQPEVTRETEKMTPVSLTMQRVLAVVRSILQLNQSIVVRPDANFDELGGTSLKQVALCSRLSKEFGVQVPLRLIIERPRLSAIADAIDSMLSSSQNHSTRPVRTTDGQRLSPVELEWLEKYQLDVGTSAFNVFYAATFSAAVISQKRLRDAWNTVLARHSILKSRYTKQPGSHGARRLSDCAPRAHAVSEMSLWTEVNRPFHVAHNDPIRVLVGQDSMVVVVSHIIADFTALAVLLEEVNMVYSGQELPSIVKTYDEADVWFKEAPFCYKTWWLEYLTSLPRGPSLLKPEQKRKSYNGSSLVSKMPQSLYSKMKQLTTKVRVSMQQLVLAAVGLVLASEDTGEDGKLDILLGSPYINRPTDDDLSVVGLYLEPLPVRITYPSSEKISFRACSEQNKEDQDFDQGEKEGEHKIIQDGSSSSYLKTVARSSQMALAHAIPWHQLLEIIGSDIIYPSHPLFDIMVSFHEPAQMKRIGNVIPGVEPCFAWSEGSKFKLMVEFSAFGEELLIMRLEHDTDLFSAEDIYRLEAMIPMALDMLTDIKRDMKIAEILNSLRKVGRSQGSSTVLNSEDVFGKRIDQL